MEETTAVETRGADPTSRRLWFILYLVVTGAITGIAFWAVGQTGLWPTVVALFLCAYMVLWGLITAE